MKRKRDTDIMITPKEAATFANYATQRDLSYCYELYHEYLKKEPFKANDLFYTMCVFACMYNAGRIQGILEERKSRKNKKSPCNLAGCARGKSNKLLSNYNMEV